MLAVGIPVELSQDKNYNIIMRKFFIVLACALGVLSASGRNLKGSPDAGHGLWWTAPEQPSVMVTVADTTGAANNSAVILRVVSDRDPGMLISEMSYNVSLLPGEEKSLEYNFGLPGPGFYKCAIADDGNVIGEFNIGYEPELVVSLPDARPDFDEFWERALDELAAVPGDYTMQELPGRSGKKRAVYAVTMQSAGGETIDAIAAIPRADGKYPVIIYYNGYGAKPWDLDADSRDDVIEIQTSVRGQFLSEHRNVYGDWVRYRLDDPEKYYYRGAFMDAVRAVDFACQLPQADAAAIFAEGGSQGGALTLAAASLCGGRLRGIMPHIPFLSDFPDYFKIVEWPAAPVLAKAAGENMTPERMYANLSYFDMKNHARRIKCSVLMGIGLQDPTCPPHTNMASYALLRVPRQLVIYPLCGHTVDYSDWNPRRDAFIKSLLDK